MALGCPCILPRPPHGRQRPRLAQNFKPKRIIPPRGESSTVRIRDLLEPSLVLKVDPEQPVRISHGHCGPVLIERPFNTYNLFLRPVQVSDVCERDVFRDVLLQRQARLRKRADVGHCRVDLDLAGAEKSREAARKLLRQRIAHQSPSACG